MSASDEIQVSLSAFEKLHILRSELEARKKELGDVEAEVRDKLQLQAKQRYLESLSPYYAGNPVEGLPSREEIEALQTRRKQLRELIENIEATIPVMLKAAENGGGEPEGASPSAPSAAAPARKAKFDF